MGVDTQGQPSLIYLHLSDSNPVTEEEITLADGKNAKVLWKDVLVEGEYPMSPGPSGATDEPMRVIADGPSDYRTKTISMSDLVASHEDGAFKYVTIPTTHRDGVLDNTGYVPSPNGTLKAKGGVRIVEKEGRKVFQAALGFTEPDVKGKVERGTIPDVSGGIFFNWLNKHTKKRYPVAMKHVALTPVPFMGNLDPFPASLLSDEGYTAEDISNVPVEVYEFAEGDTSSTSTTATSDNTGNNVEVVWDETKSHRYVQTQIDAALNPQRDQPDDGRPYIPRPSYFVQDVSHEDKTALVEEYFKGEQRRFVIPFSRAEDGTVTVSPSLRWVEAKEAMIAASDDFENVASTTLREKISLALSEQIGVNDGVKYRVEDVSLDNRACITSNAKNKTWLASFALLSDGSVWVAPSDTWDVVKAPEKKSPADAQQPAPATPTVILSDDPMRERLEAARQRRRRLLSSSDTTPKEV